MSKGGDSSNSASAQTPSQWASALTSASISAWKEADILSFSVAQLQALTPGQISNITVPWAVPMAVWTADTLNAVPLQYWSQWGTRYLSSTSNGVVSITPLSQSSNGAVSGKNNWFDDVGRGAAGFAFTPSVVAGISDERIAQIGGGVGRNQTSVACLTTNAGYVSHSDFTAALSAATASGANVVTWNISATQTAYMFASGWADMGADFMGALTYSQLGAIAHPESALGAAQFGYLSANQLNALGKMDWSRVTSAQLNATKISAFQGLQSNVLQAISAQTWAGLDQAHTAVLNAADVQLLPATTIARMNYFGYALTASVGAVLTAAQVASIPSTCWAQISDSRFLNSLSTAAFQAIPVSAFASMVDAVVASLDSRHVAALTLNQAQNYPLSKLSDASSAFYQNPNTLNFETFVSQSNVNWALAPASFIKLLTPAQLRLISPSQMAALTPSALSGLTRAQTQALSLAQIQALSARQLSAMAYISRRTDVVQEVFSANRLTQLSLSFWGNVDSNFLNALALNAFQAITTAQLQAISASAFANLDQAHVNALTGTQLLALTAEQVGQFNGAYLGITFLRGVRLAAFKGLVPDQMHRLHDYLFNTVVNNAFATDDPTLLENAENQFASLLASILESDDGREAWLEQSVNLLIQLRWLDPTAAANLSASDVTTTYVVLDWSWMSGTFLNSISTAVFAQLQASSVAQFNLTALAELNDAYLQALTVTQASALSGEQLSVIGNLGALQAGVVQSLSATQLANIHQDWSQISANFLNNMTAGQFMALTPAQFGQMRVAQFAGTALNWGLMSGAQLNALALDEFRQLCSGVNPAILSTDVTALVDLGGEQLAILAQESLNYTDAQNYRLLNKLFGTFNADQTQRMMNLMIGSSVQQMVLQVGLINLLDKMSGSSTGVDTAIQTLMALKQTQPSWFSADNLSTVLPILDSQYRSVLSSYQSTTYAQTLYNQVFATASILPLVLSRQGLTFDSRALIPGALLQSLGPAFSEIGRENFMALIKAKNPMMVEQAIGEILSQTRSKILTTGVLADAIANGRVSGAQATTYLGEIIHLVKQEWLEDYAQKGTLASGFNAIKGWIEARLFSSAHSLQDAVLQEVERDASHDMTKAAKTASATQSIMALGNLLVMLSAATGEIGRAINAADDDELSQSERDQLIVPAALSALAFVTQGLQLPMAMVVQALVRRATGDPEYVGLSKGQAIWKQFSEGYSYFYQRTKLQILAQREVNRLPQAAPASQPLDLTATSGKLIANLNSEVVVVKMKTDELVGSFKAFFDEQGNLIKVLDRQGLQKAITMASQTVLESLPREATQRTMLLVTGHDKNRDPAVLNRDFASLLRQQVALKAKQSSTVIANLERFIYVGVEGGYWGVGRASRVDVAVLDWLQQRGVGISPSLRHQVQNIADNLDSGFMDWVFADKVRALLSSGLFTPQSTDAQIGAVLATNNLDATQVGGAKAIMGQVVDDLVLTTVVEAVNADMLSISALELQNGQLKQSINTALRDLGITAPSPYLHNRITDFIVEKITHATSLTSISILNLSSGANSALRIYKAAMNNGVIDDPRVIDYINAAIVSEIPIPTRQAGLTGILENVVDTYTKMVNMPRIQTADEPAPVEDRVLGYAFVEMLMETAVQNIQAEARKNAISVVERAQRVIDPDFIGIAYFDATTRAQVELEIAQAVRNTMNSLTSDVLWENFEKVLTDEVNRRGRPDFNKMLREFADAHGLQRWEGNSLNRAIALPTGDELMQAMWGILQRENPTYVGVAATKLPVELFPASFASGSEVQAAGKVLQVFNQLATVHPDLIPAVGSQSLWEIEPVMSADGKTVLQQGTYKAWVSQQIERVLQALVEDMNSQMSWNNVRFQNSLEEIPALWQEYISSAEYGVPVTERSFQRFMASYQQSGSKVVDTTLAAYIRERLPQSYRVAVNAAVDSAKRKLIINTIQDEIQAQLDRTDFTAYKSDRTLSSEQKQEAAIAAVQKEMTVRQEAVEQARNFIMAMGEDPASPQYARLPVLDTQARLISLAKNQPAPVARPQDITLLEAVLEGTPQSRTAKPDVTMSRLLANEGWAPESTDGGAVLGVKGLVVGEQPRSLADVVDPVLSKKLVVALVDQLAIDSHAMTENGAAGAGYVLNSWMKSITEKLLDADGANNTLQERLQKFIIDNQLSLTDQGKTSRGIAVDTDILLEEMARRLEVEHSTYTPEKIQAGINVVVKKQDVPSIAEGVYKAFVYTANLPLSDSQLSYKLAFSIVEYLITERNVFGPSRDNISIPRVVTVLNNALSGSNSALKQMLSTFADTNGLVLHEGNLNRRLAVDADTLAGIIAERMTLIANGKGADTTYTAGDVFTGIQAAGQAGLVTEVATKIVPFVVQNRVAPTVADSSIATAIKLGRLVVDFAITTLQQRNPDLLGEPNLGATLVDTISEELGKPELAPALKTRLKAFWQSVPRDADGETLPIQLAPETLQALLFEGISYKTGKAEQADPEFFIAFRKNIQDNAAVLGGIHDLVSTPREFANSLEAKLAIPDVVLASETVHPLASASLKNATFSRNFATMLVGAALDRVNPLTDTPAVILTQLRWVLHQVERLAELANDSTVVDKDFMDRVGNFLRQNPVETLADGQMSRQLTVDRVVLATALQAQLKPPRFRLELQKNGQVVTEINQQDILRGFQAANLIVDVEVVRQALRAYIDQIPITTEVEQVALGSERQIEKSLFGAEASSLTPKASALPLDEGGVFRRLSVKDVTDTVEDASVGRQAGIVRAQDQLEGLKMAVMNYGMLGFALFSSVIGMAAGLAGILYATQATTLSWQAKAMVLAMNGVRVLTSGVMLVASGAQIASSVVKGVQAAADTASIANAGFAIGNVIGITTNIAQIGIQADTLASSTDSTSRLIAGLAILDSLLQLILNVVGTVALAFGPAGMVVNLITFVIASLLPSAAAIATAVEYRKSYDDLTGQGLYKEAEVIYTHWQVAAMDASPIINWTSSIYTEEMKKSQERKMDSAWMDKSAEERLLYSLRANTALKDNFDSLRAQMYAGAVALTQPLTNLSQTLTRATMLMLSQDNLSYFEGDKLATVKLAGTLNYSTNTVSRAPKLLGANVNGQTLSLVFNQDLASLGSQLPSLSSFSVLVNGTAVTVSGLAVLNNVVTLSLASAVTAGQTVTFSYSDLTAGNDAHAVQNVLGVDAASIINRSVVNLLDRDTRAPQLADAVAQDNLLTLVFDETLSTVVGKMPVRGAFSVLVNGSAVGIYNLSVHDQRVLLSLNSPIAVGATVTVSYNADYGDGALQDAAGNLVASLNAQRVENTGATSSVTASRVGWLQYDNFVASVQGTGTEAASVLNGDDYTVYANADDATSGTSRLRYLSLSNAAGEFDMLSVTRAVENNDRIWLDASNAQGVNNFAINTHDMTVWGGQGKNSYSLARPYAAQSYIVAANAWSDRNNVISISGSASDTSKKVNLDYFLSADNISAGLPGTQTAFTVLGANDGLDVVVGSGDNQSYMATSNLANINLTGANANVSVGESAQVNVGVNGRVQVDMDMWRGLNVEAPTAGVFNGVIKGNYGSYSLLNFAPTDSLNANFNGKLNLSYQIGHLPRLDAFSVYVGSTLVGVNSLSVNGKTLTLNLSSAVAQNEVVSVSYADASSADDDNTLQGLTGKDVNSFSRQAVVNTTADTTAPKLAVATVQGNSLIVHFSEALQQSYRPLNSAWSVYVGGNRVAVNTVAFNDTSSLRLTLASAVAAGQTVSLNYSAASDTSVAVQDLAGNVTSSFSSASVINLANVTQAPNLRTVTANGNVLTLTFDGTVRYTLSNPSAFVVTANNTPLNISGVSVAGNSVLLSLTSAVSSGQLVEVSYSPPQQLSDATTLRDWLGNAVGSISAQVANNITGQDLTPPSLQYAIVNGTSLVLTFSEALNNQAGFTPLPSEFAVNVNGTAVNVTQAVVSGSTVTLTLASAANYGDTMTLSYTDLSAGNDAAVVQDVAGNDAASFANVNVINNTPDTTPPTLLSATVNGNQLSLLFSESLNASSGYLPALTSMAVTVNGVAVSISAGSVIGGTATLTLGTAVNAGDYVNFNYTAPSGNALQAFQDGAGNDLLSIANFNVTNSTGLDVTPPSLVSAQVNGTILTLTFSEALVSTASFTPGASAFTVSVDGNLATVSGVRLNGTQALLTLASAVDNTAKVTVGYVRPSDASSTQAIQDGAQNMATSFSAQSVNNVTADTTPPSLSSASVAGAMLTLTFSESLATSPELLASAKEFTVTVDGQAVDVLSAVSSGNSVSITLSKAVMAGQSVSVDYTASTSDSNVLQDSANNKTANFSRTVTNFSGLASIQNATVNGTTLSLIFNQELDANSTHLPPLSAFAVKVNGVSSAVSNLAVSGHVVTLTLGAAVTAEQTVTVNYTSTDNDLTALQNRSGLDVQSFSAPYAVHNLTSAQPVATPHLEQATVKGSTLTLTFSEALDAGVGEWWVNYLPDGQYDASGHPLVTSRVKASGFVNVLGSNNNDSFIIGDQSGLETARQLGYVQLGNGQGVQVNYYDTSGNLFLAMGNKGQANVILESGSSLQKLLTAKLVQSDADIAHYKANRDTVTLKSLSSLTAFLSGYETIDATDSTSSLTAEIGEGDHQIKLGGQTVHLQFDKVVSNTSISTRQIPNSWLDYQYLNFNGINADGLWVGRESDGTVLFKAQWKDGTANDALNVSYDGTLSNVVFEVGNVVSGSKTSQLRLDKLIEAMSAPAFSTDANAVSYAVTDAGTATKLYRVTDIVAYNLAPQSSVSGGV